MRHQQRGRETLGPLGGGELAWAGKRGPEGKEGLPGDTGVGAEGTGRRTEQHEATGGTGECVLANFF